MVQCSQRSCIRKRILLFIDSRCSCPSDLSDLSDLFMLIPRVKQYRSARSLHALFRALFQHSRSRLHAKFQLARQLCRSDFFLGCDPFLFHNGSKADDSDRSRAAATSARGMAPKAKFLRISQSSFVDSPALSSLRRESGSLLSPMWESSRCGLDYALLESQ